MAMDGGGGLLLGLMVALVVLMVAFFVATGRARRPHPSGGFAAGAAGASGPPVCAWGAGSTTPPKPDGFGGLWPPSPPCGYFCSVNGLPEGYPPCGPGSYPQYHSHVIGPRGLSEGMYVANCDLSACDTDGSCKACLNGTGPARDKCVAECSAKTPYNSAYPQSWAACWNDCCSKNYCHGMVNNDPACASPINPSRLGRINPT